MADLLTASTSKGRMTITETVVRLHLPGASERSILRSAITDVTISLGFWYFVGFFRVLTIRATGEQRPIVLANMSKRKAYAARQLLGF